MKKTGRPKMAGKMKGGKAIRKKAPGIGKAAGRRKNQLANASGSYKQLQCAILVGGLGTRLRPLTYNVPKPLVPVNGKPFIHYVLSLVSGMGLKSAVLLCGYMHRQVESYCKDGSQWGIGIRYSIEKRPLGTGGALWHASGMIGSDCLVMNGDTYLDMEIEKAYEKHRKSKALATIICMRGSLKARGALVLDSTGRVKSFLEKQNEGEGVFNTGSFIISREGLDMLGRIAEGKGLGFAFSTEKDIFPEFARIGRLYACVAEGKFVDMGTFENLARAGEIME